MSIECYKRHFVLPLDENMMFEFKAHRQLSDTDLSSLKTTVSRNGETIAKIPLKRVSISRAFCGMLNTRKGGTVFMGVTDSGLAEGFSMSRFQQEHFLLALEDLFMRYDPPVPGHLYNIAFVPVVDLDEDVFKPDNWLETRHPAGQRLREVPHELRSSRYCWCDCFTLAAQERGLVHRFYVIEVRFMPWKREDFSSWTKSCVSKNVCLFKNEIGDYLIRRNGITSTVSMEDLKKFS